MSPIAFNEGKESGWARSSIGAPLRHR